MFGLSRVAEWLNAPAVKAGGERNPREFESRLERTKQCVWVAYDGVSDKAIVKWFKRYGLPFKKQELKEYIRESPSG